MSDKKTIGVAFDKAKRFRDPRYLMVIETLWLSDRCPDRTMIEALAMQDALTGKIVEHRRNQNAKPIDPHFTKRKE